MFYLCSFCLSGFDLERIERAFFRLDKNGDAQLDNQDLLNLIQLQRRRCGTCTPGLARPRRIRRPLPAARLPPPPP